MENLSNYLRPSKKKQYTWLTLENGVYAVSAAGIPVMKEDADESCIGVALITDNQKTMIAKEDATDGTNISLYWGYNLKDKNVAGITDINDEEVAKTNFNGKANTAAIITAYTEHGVEMNSRDMCKVLQDFNTAEETDWYIPAFGQLYEMCQNKVAIEEMLAVIGGTNFSRDGVYWSSSEYRSPYGWVVNLNNGNAFDYSKRGYYFVRFVRDLI